MINRIQFNILLILGICVMLGACKTSFPSTIYDQSKSIEKDQIDYKNLSFWAAHPDKVDEADKIPDSKQLADQSNLDADIFFIHPTTYTGKKGQNQWNGSIHDQDLQKRTDESSIRYQASIFNEAGRIYAPRYRQAHIYAYFSEDKSSSKQAFELAYQDLKNAFEYYLEYENHQRPFILASHSQGTTHASRLIKELIDGKPLQEKLIAAYLIGMPILYNEFVNLKPCISENQTNCTISWRTYKKGHFPESIVGDHILVTNPLSWTIDDKYQPKSENKGAVLRNFNKVFDQRVDAQVNNGVLWATKPKFPWSFLFTTDNYHIADLNFYYMNVRQNAIIRVNEFLEKN